MINLAAVWGLGQERGKEAVCEEARKVVTLARMKRESYRGVIDVVYGGGEGLKKQPEAQKLVVANGLKRKAPDSLNIGEQQEEEASKPLSKRQMKKQAKQARADAANKNDTPTKPGTTNGSTSKATAGTASM